MKKLILTGIIVCVAIASQASSVTWGLLTGTTLDTSVYSSGTAYLICATDLAKPTLADESAAQTWYGENGSSLSTKAFRSATVTDGYTTSNESIAQAIGRKNYWLVVVNADEDHFAVSSITKALNITTSSMSVVASWDGSAQMTSYAIPEPTSALLLMLGVAGLMLRRKQK